MKEVYFSGKPIFIKIHAIKRARERNITYPDHVYTVLKTGKVKRFGRRGIKFISRSTMVFDLCSRNVAERMARRGVPFG